MEDQMQQALVAAMRDDPRPQWKQTAGDIFDSVFDFIMGGAGVPGTPDSKSKQWGELLSAAVPVLGGVKAMKAIKPIRAFHGSPHDFDKFSLSKIGTGEGAQAYGHGLYFAENEGVAKAYRQAALNPEIEQINERMRALSGVMEADAVPGGWRQFRSESGRKAAAEYDALMDRRAELGKGKMYQVEINANPDDFLDWDAPLSQQAPKVREVLDRAYRETAMVDPSKAATPKTGAAIYDDMRVGVGGLETKAKAPASEYLKELGIPGIKYLDQGSRAAGEGSRNYVVFDDQLISIVKKYGIVGALSAGLINEAQARQLKEQGIK